MANYSSTLQVGHFPHNLAHVSVKTDLIFVKMYVSLNKEVAAEFWKSSDSALAEVCAFRVHGVHGALVFRFSVAQSSLCCVHSY